MIRPCGDAPVCARPALLPADFILALENEVLLAAGVSMSVQAKAGWELQQHRPCCTSLRSTLIMLPVG